MLIIPNQYILIELLIDPIPHNPLHCCQAHQPALSWLVLAALLKQWYHIRQPPVFQSIICGYKWRKYLYKSVCNFFPSFPQGSRIKVQAWVLIHLNVFYDRKHHLFLNLHMVQEGTIHLPEFLSFHDIHHSKIRQEYIFKISPIPAAPSIDTHADGTYSFPSQHFT